MKILVIHGPNLCLLGEREPQIYGNIKLSDINESIERKARELGVEIEIFQANGEGEIVDKIIDSKDKIDGILINPAAYTHTSIAIRDCISGVGLPAVEVHLSNIYAREEFRKRSMIAPVCIGQVSGFGMMSYLLGLEALVRWLENER